MEAKWARPSVRRVWARASRVSCSSMARASKKAGAGATAPGVTSSALVVDFLRQRGFSPRAYLPSRHHEGYGLNAAGLKRLHDEGVRLLLTVDCGVANCAEIAAARDMGLTVVVSDHHLPGEALPPAAAVCNPRLADGPCADLAGVGVAFLLMAALNRQLPGAPLDMRQFLDLAALGSLADVVPLTGQNRVLVKNGLLLISEAPRPGIAALKEVSGYDPAAPLGAGQVSFGLAPRINAAGRMGEATVALDLLLAPDLATARPLAAELDRLNRLRQREEEEIQQAAMDQAAQAARAGRLGFVLHEPHWHHGVIGIVASRVVERHYRPTLILCQEKGRLKGSGRSVAEFDLHAALAECEDLLLGFGGHRQAAGLSLDPANLEALRQRFHEVVARRLGPEPLPPTLALDAELSLAEIRFDLLKELELLQPFGCANPEPVFLSPPLTVRSLRLFGQDHASLELREPATGVCLRAKAWRMASDLPSNLVGRSLRAAFTPRVDTFNGLAQIELNLKDFNMQS